MVRNSRASASDAALTVADRVLSKNSEYLAPITQSQTLALDLAGRISTAGDITDALLTHAGDDERVKAKMVQFLEEQRGRLKKFAVDNVRRERDVRSFVGAVGEIRDELRLKRQAAANATLDNDDDDEANAALKKQREEEDAVDYEAAIVGGIDRHRAEANANGGDVSEEPMVQEMGARLGEKPAKKKKRGKAAADDDDDDLEVINDAAAGHETEQNLKCPILAQLFVNPVKNRICGHTYSKAGLDHLRNTGPRRGQCDCPVPGCGNKNLKMGDMEEDIEMAMRVKRFVKRAERERAARMSQMDDVDDLDGEDEGEETEDRKPAEM